MNRSVLRKIAKQNGVSVAEVKREIQLAIEAAYENPNAAALDVPRKGSVPTPEELIEFIVRRVVSQPSEARILH